MNISILFPFPWNTAIYQIWLPPEPFSSCNLYYIYLTVSWFSDLSNQRQRRKPDSIINPFSSHLPLVLWHRTFVPMPRWSLISVLLATMFVAHVRPLAKFPWCNLILLKPGCSHWRINAFGLLSLSIFSSIRFLASHLKVSQLLTEGLRSLSAG